MIYLEKIIHFNSQTLDKFKRSFSIEKDLFFKTESSDWLHHHLKHL